MLYLCSDIEGKKGSKVTSCILYTLYTL